MIEKGKISAFQMAIIIVPVIFSTAILIVPAITGKYAGRDMWISPIFGSLNGFLTTFIIYRLHKYYPNESIIQYCNHIIGPYLGKALGLVYLVFFLHASGNICREYADFVISSFLPKTPMIVVVGILVLVSAFAVKGGVEVLGRTAEVLVPLFLLPPILFFLLIRNLKTENILPLMENGILPPILGAAVPQAWFSQVFLISMILPFLSDRENGGKWGMVTIFFSMMAMVFTNIISIFLFGGSVSSYNYPVFTAFRYIGVGGFFEHLESLVISNWVMGVFVKISVFYYALVLGTAQWLHLSDYRHLVFPIGFLIMIFTFWTSPNVQELGKYFVTTAPFYLSSLMTYIPMILLFIMIIRGKWKNKQEIKMRRIDND
ncbi:endospore germination permease [Bacillus salipaludis]|uniref:GerAB/ArcD/ProY family transporter n=1 Tax=Bacillus salipaludis TaxID=2547811 RepID=UPI002E1B72E9|nr:endospore germination permease [Bacillus salipaludis]